jgi:3-hydroxyisobutyrate dehydrogenase-like beta-hydroxyacid dehydrogenase
MSATDQDSVTNSAIKLGFIGLGYMGSRIAKRLIDANHSLVVFNRNHAKTQTLASHGAQVAGSPAELATGTDVILSCLTDGRAVRDVYMGDGGVLDYARPGAVIIEMSTIKPEISQLLYQAGRERGIAVLDVAISGSTPAAQSGALTLFGGGEHDAFENATPIFQSIAKQWFYMGPTGSGVAMKLVVNTLLGVGMQAIAEAVALGHGLGIQRDLLLDALAKTAVVASAHAGKLATAKRNDYAPQFPIRLMNKDFLLIGAKAAELGVAMPATAEAAKIAADEASSGQEEDFSTVIRAMEEMANTSAIPPKVTVQLNAERRF